MSHPDAFALTTSDLNPFLFAGVGTELNGSELTILSLLARLGSDPWAEARRLATLPRLVATDWLAERIACMPLSPQALDETRATASRLVLLLPAQAKPFRISVSAKVDAVKTPRWGMIAIILGVLALGVAASFLHAPPPPDRTLQTDGASQHAD